MVAIIRLLVLFLLLLPVNRVVATTDAPILRAGVASMITPVSAVKYYQQVVDYLGKKLGIKARMVHRTTYDEIDTMLEQGEVDVAFICSAPYVYDSEKFGVQLLVAPQVNGEAHYRSNIIVHKDSHIQSVADLKNQSFVFVDPKSNTGKLYPTYLLAKQNETPESYFSSFLFSYSHNKSVEMVAKKRVTAAAVDSIVYSFMLATNSPYAQQTRIIHRSPTFGIPPVVVPQNLSPYLRKSLLAIFLEMHLDPEGQKILEAMKIEKFIEVPDSNYDSIRAMKAFLTNTPQNANQPSPRNRNKKGREAPVLFGVLPRDNPIIAYERYQPLVDYLSQATNTRFELHLDRSYQAAVQSLGRGKVAFALLGPLTYLDAYKRFDAAPIAKSVTGRGETYFRSVIVTGLDGSIKELPQLVDKKFAFSALWSTSGNLIPRYMLAWSGIHLDNLKEYHHYNYHDTVAKKVISGEFDAGAIRLSTAERYLPYGLKVVATSDPIPTGPVVVSPATPYTMVKKVQKALLEMNKSTAGKAVLKKLDPDLQGGFVAASDADYSPVREMINAVPKTCGRGCHPNVTF